nr:G protein-coupled receptor [Proales similis]
MGTEFTDWINDTRRGVNGTICLVGCTLNIFSAIVLFKVKLKHQVYKLILASILVDIVYLLLCALFELSRCGSQCRDGSSLAEIAYQLYAIKYLSTALAVFNILVELTLCAQRLIALTSVFKSEIPVGIWKLLGVYSIIASVVVSPILASKCVAVLDNGRFELGLTEIGRQGLDDTFHIVFYAFRGGVVMIVVIIVNLVSVYKFRLLMKKKSELRHSPSSSSQVNTNMTKLTFTMSAMYVLTNLPYSASGIVRQFYEPNSPVDVIASALSNTFLFIFHSIHFFLLFRFNKAFRCYCVSLTIKLKENMLRKGRNAEAKAATKTSSP